jgi:hypothetical protein
MAKVEKDCYKTNNIVGGCCGARKFNNGPVGTIGFIYVRPT